MFLFGPAHGRFPVGSTRLPAATKGRSVSDETMTAALLLQASKPHKRQRLSPRSLSGNIPAVTKPRYSY
ncbi:hypothetical protein M378DRAFT_582146 [Amanita muscaria Koide BX008]|uniref:Uncharacterized protein n=1 Tax=Amanita muscaria (strain Koide BX008) TaxID=946122 RepID=A0A0C2X5T0_AMAMK|nr:hypothetical protein M378DRAFT_582146 [Amanita muscaria Koide BX008]